ncbi:hypothetical protein, partial [Pseudomonas syringae group genomosp. 7]|uniref:hypothetical protein n=1 Tax=Pseudomonas syringae group genomosp. 7 TaxID=251699 RepID=UPI003770632B
CCVLFVVVCGVGVCCVFWWCVGGFGCVWVFVGFFGFWAVLGVVGVWGGGVFDLVWFVGVFCWFFGVCCFWFCGCLFVFFVGWWVVCCCGCVADGVAFGSGVGRRLVRLD